MKRLLSESEHEINSWNENLSHCAEDESSQDSDEYDEEDYDDEDDDYGNEK